MIVECNEHDRYKEHNKEIREGILGLKKGWKHTGSGVSELQTVLFIPPLFPFTLSTT
jgi:hypothetical protein